MGRIDWTSSCTGRLCEQWPQVDFIDLAHIAEALYREARWRIMEPRDAAMGWLDECMNSERIAQA